MFVTEGPEAAAAVGGLLEGLLEGVMDAVMDAEINAGVREVEMLGVGVTEATGRVGVALGEGVGEGVTPEAATVGVALGVEEVVTFLGVEVMEELPREGVALGVQVGVIVGLGDLPLVAVGNSELVADVVVDFEVEDVTVRERDVIELAELKGVTEGTKV